MSKANEKMYRTICLLTFFLLNILNFYADDVYQEKYQTKVYFYSSEDHHYKGIEPEIFYLNKKYNGNQDQDLISDLSKIPALTEKNYFIKEQEEDSVIFIFKDSDLVENPEFDVYFLKNEKQQDKSTQTDDELTSSKL